METFFPAERRLVWTITALSMTAWFALFMWILPLYPDATTPLQEQLLRLSRFLGLLTPVFLPWAVFFFVKGLRMRSFTKLGLAYSVISILAATYVSYQAVKALVSVAANWY